MEQIRELLQSAPLAAATAEAPAPQKVITSEPGFAYIDNQDANWLYDTEFHPVDLNSIPVQAFVVYKFGPVADLGGLGGCSPPPAISGHTKRWMCCYKNTLILANSVIFVHFNA